VAHDQQRHPQPWCRLAVHAQAWSRSARGCGADIALSSQLTMHLAALATCARCRAAAWGSSMHVWPLKQSTQNRRNTEGRQSLSSPARRRGCPSPAARWGPPPAPPPAPRTGAEKSAAAARGPPVWRLAPPPAHTAARSPPRPLRWSRLQCVGGLRIQGYKNPGANSSTVSFSSMPTAADVSDRCGSCSTARKAQVQTQQ
jgi:hypothetical protein